MFASTLHSAQQFQRTADILEERDPLSNRCGTSRMHDEPSTPQQYPPPLLRSDEFIFELADQVPRLRLDSKMSHSGTVGIGRINDRIRQPARTIRGLHGNANVRAHVACEASRRTRL